MDYRELVTGGGLGRAEVEEWWEELWEGRGKFLKELLGYKGEGMKGSWGA